MEETFSPTTKESFDLELDKASSYSVTQTPPEPLSPKKEEDISPVTEAPSDIRKLKLAVGVSPTDFIAEEPEYLTSDLAQETIDEQEEDEAEGEAAQLTKEQAKKKGDVLLVGESPVESPDEDVQIEIPPQSKGTESLVSISEISEIPEKLEETVTTATIETVVKMQSASVSSIEDAGEGSAATEYLAFDNMAFAGKDRIDDFESPRALDEEEEDDMMEEFARAERELITTETPETLSVEQPKILPSPDTEKRQIEQQLQTLPEICKEPPTESAYEKKSPEVKETPELVQVVAPEQPEWHALEMAVEQPVEEVKELCQLSPIEGYRGMGSSEEELSKFTGAPEVHVERERHEISSESDASYGEKNADYEMEDLQVKMTPTTPLPAHQEQEIDVDDDAEGTATPDLTKLGSPVTDKPAADLTLTTQTTERAEPSDLPVTVRSPLEELSVDLQTLAMIKTPEEIPEGVPEPEMMELMPDSPEQEYLPIGKSAQVDTLDILHDKTQEKEEDLDDDDANQEQMLGIGQPKEYGKDTSSSEEDYGDDDYQDGSQPRGAEYIPKTSQKLPVTQDVYLPETDQLLEIHIERVSLRDPTSLETEVVSEQNLDIVEERPSQDSAQQDEFNKIVVERFLDTQETASQEKSSSMQEATMREEIRSILDEQRTDITEKSILEKELISVTQKRLEMVEDSVETAPSIKQEIHSMLDEQIRDTHEQSSLEKEFVSVTHEKLDTTAESTIQEPSLREEFHSSLDQQVKYTDEKSTLEKESISVTHEMLEKELESAPEEPSFLEFHSMIKEELKDTREKSTHEEEISSVTHKTSEEKIISSPQDPSQSKEIISTTDDRSETRVKSTCDEELSTSSAVSHEWLSSLTQDSSLREEFYSKKEEKTSDIHEKLSLEKESISMTSEKVEKTETKESEKKTALEEELVQVAGQKLDIITQQPSLTDEFRDVIDDQFKDTAEESPLEEELIKLAQEKIETAHESISQEPLVMEAFTYEADKQSEIPKEELVSVTDDVIDRKDEFSTILETRMKDLPPEKSSPLSEEDFPLEPEDYTLEADSMQSSMVMSEKDMTIDYPPDKPLEPEDFTLEPETDAATSHPQAIEEDDEDDGFVLVEREAIDTHEIRSGPPELVVSSDRAAMLLMDEQEPTPEPSPQLDFESSPAESFHEDIIEEESEKEQESADVAIVEDTIEKSMLPVLEASREQAPEDDDEEDDEEGPSDDDVKPTIVAKPLTEMMWPQEPIGWVEPEKPIVPKKEPVQEAIIPVESLKMEAKKEQAPEEESSDEESSQSTVHEEIKATTVKPVKSEIVWPSFLEDPDIHKSGIGKFASPVELEPCDEVIVPSKVEILRAKKEMAPEDSSSGEEEEIKPKTAKPLKSDMIRPSVPDEVEKQAEVCIVDTDGIVEPHEGITEHHQAAVIDTILETRTAELETRLGAEMYIHELEEEATLHEVLEERESSMEYSSSKTVSFESPVHTSRADSMDTTVSTETLTSSFATAATSLETSLDYKSRLTEVFSPETGPSSYETAPSSLDQDKPDSPQNLFESASTDFPDAETQQKPLLAETTLTKPEKSSEIPEEVAFFETAKDTQDEIVAFTRQDIPTEDFKDVKDDECTRPESPPEFPEYTMTQEKTEDKTEDTWSDEIAAAPRDDLLPESPEEFEGTLEDVIRPESPEEFAETKQYDSDKKDAFTRQDIPAESPEEFRETQKRTDDKSDEIMAFTRQEIPAEFPEEFGEIQETTEDKSDEIEAFTRQEIPAEFPEEFRESLETTEDKSDKIEAFTRQEIPAEFPEEFRETLETTEDKSDEIEAFTRKEIIAEFPEGLKDIEDDEDTRPESPPEFPEYTETIETMKDELDDKAISDEIAAVPRDDLLPESPEEFEGTLEDAFTRPESPSEYPDIPAEYPEEFRETPKRTDDKSDEITAFTRQEIPAEFPEEFRGTLETSKDKIDEIEAFTRQEIPAEFPEEFRETPEMTEDKSDEIEAFTRKEIIAEFPEGLKDIEDDEYTRPESPPEFPEYTETVETMKDELDDKAISDEIASVPREDLLPESPEEFEGTLEDAFTRPESPSEYPEELSKTLDRTEDKHDEIAAFTTQEIPAEVSAEFKDIVDDEYTRPESPPEFPEFSDTLEIMKDEFDDKEICEEIAAVQREDLLPESPEEFEGTLEDVIRLESPSEYPEDITEDKLVEIAAFTMQEIHAEFAAEFKDIVDDEHTQPESPPEFPEFSDTLEIMKDEFDDKEICEEIAAVQREDLLPESPEEFEGTLEDVIRPESPAECPEEFSKTQGITEDKYDEVAVLSKEGSHPEFATDLIEPKVQVEEVEGEEEMDTDESDELIPIPPPHTDTLAVEDSDSPEPVTDEEILEKETDLHVQLLRHLSSEPSQDDTEEEDVSEHEHPHKSPARTEPAREEHRSEKDQALDEFEKAETASIDSEELETTYGTMREMQDEMQTEIAPSVQEAEVRDEQADQKSEEEADIAPLVPKQIESISSEDMKTSSSSDASAEPTILAASYDLDSGAVSRVVATFDISPDTVEKTLSTPTQPKAILSSPEDEVFEVEHELGKKKASAPQPDLVQVEVKTPEKERVMAEKASEGAPSELAKIPEDMLESVAPLEFKASPEEAVQPAEAAEAPGSPFEIVSPADLVDYDEYMAVTQQAMQDQAALEAALAEAQDSDTDITAKTTTEVLKTTMELGIGALTPSAPAEEPETPSADQSSPISSSEPSIGPVSPFESVLPDLVQQVEVQEEAAELPIEPPAEAGEEETGDRYAHTNGPTEVDYMPEIDEVPQPVPESLQPEPQPDVVLLPEAPILEVFVEPREAPEAPSSAAAVAEVDVVVEGSAEEEAEACAPDTPAQPDLEPQEIRAEVQQRHYEHFEPEEEAAASPVVLATPPLMTSSQFSDMTHSAPVIAISPSGHVPSEEPTVMTESLIEDLHPYSTDAMITSDQTLYDFEMPSEEISPQAASREAPETDMSTSAELRDAMIESGYTEPPLGESMTEDDEQVAKQTTDVSVSTDSGAVSRQHVLSIEEELHSQDKVTLDLKTDLSPRSGKEALDSDAAFDAFTGTVVAEVPQQFPEQEEHFDRSSDSDSDAGTRAQDVYDIQDIMQNQEDQEEQELVSASQTTEETTTLECYPTYQTDTAAEFSAVLEPGDDLGEFGAGYPTHPMHYELPEPLESPGDRPESELQALAEATHETDLLELEDQRPTSEESGLTRESSSRSDSQLRDIRSSDEQEEDRFDIQPDPADLERPRSPEPDPSHCLSDDDTAEARDDGDESDEDLHVTAHQFVESVMEEACGMVHEVPPEILLPDQPPCQLLTTTKPLEDAEALLPTEVSDEQKQDECEDDVKQVTPGKAMPLVPEPGETLKDLGEEPVETRKPEAIAVDSETKLTSVVSSESHTDSPSQIAQPSMGEKWQQVEGEPEEFEADILLEPYEKEPKSDSEMSQDKSVDGADKSDVSHALFEAEEFEKENQEEKIDVESKFDPKVKEAEEHPPKTEDLKTRVESDSDDDNIPIMAAATAAVSIATIGAAVALDKMLTAESSCEPEETFEDARDSPLKEKPKDSEYSESEKTSLESQLSEAQEESRPSCQLIEPMYDTVYTEPTMPDIPEEEGSSGSSGGEKTPEVRSPEVSSTTFIEGFEAFAAESTTSQEVEDISISTAVEAREVADLMSPEDQGDSSSVDSFATVVAAHQEEEEDRMAEVSSMTSSFHSDMQSSYHDDLQQAEIKIDVRDKREEMDLGESPSSEKFEMVGSEDIETTSFLRHSPEEEKYEIIRRDELEQLQFEQQDVTYSKKDIFEAVEEKLSPMEERMILEKPDVFTAEKMDSLSSIEKLSSSELLADLGKKDSSLSSLGEVDIPTISPDFPPLISPGFKTGQFFSKSGDRDDISVTSSLLEFEKLETELVLEEREDRTSQESAPGLSRPLAYGKTEKDGSVASSLAEFERLEQELLQSGSIEKVTPESRSSGENGSSMSSLNEFERLETELQSESADEQQPRLEKCSEKSSMSSLNEFERLEREMEITNELEAEAQKVVSMLESGELLPEGADSASSCAEAPDHSETTQEAERDTVDDKQYHQPISEEKVPDDIEMIIHQASISVETFGLESAPQMTGLMPQEISDARRGHSFDSEGTQSSIHGHSSGAEADIDSLDGQDDDDLDQDHAIAIPHSDVTLKHDDDHDTDSLQESDTKSRELDTDSLQDPDSVMHMSVESIEFDKKPVRSDGDKLETDSLQGQEDLMQKSSDSFLGGYELPHDVMVTSADSLQEPELTAPTTLSAMEKSADSLQQEESELVEPTSVEEVMVKSADSLQEPEPSEPFASAETLVTLASSDIAWEQVVEPRIDVMVKSVDSLQDEAVPEVMVKSADSLQEPQPDEPVPDIMVKSVDSLQEPESSDLMFRSTDSLELDQQVPQPDIMVRSADSLDLEQRVPESDSMERFDTDSLQGQEGVMEVSIESFGSDRQRPVENIMEMSTESGAWSQSSSMMTSSIRSASTVKSGDSELFKQQDFMQMSIESPEFEKEPIAPTPETIEQPLIEQYDTQKQSLTETLGSETISHFTEAEVRHMTFDPTIRSKQFYDSEGNIETDSVDSEGNFRRVYAKSDTSSEYSSSSEQKFFTMADLEAKRRAREHTRRDSDSSEKRVYTTIEPDVGKITYTIDSATSREQSRETVTNISLEPQVMSRSLEFFDPLHRSPSSHSTPSSESSHSETCYCGPAEISTAAGVATSTSTTMETSQLGGSN